MCSHGHKRGIEHGHFTTGEYNCPFCGNKLEGMQICAYIYPYWALYCSNENCSYERIEE
jgi:hypothetical protein